MNYRKFGNTELTVSEVGFGAWAIGGNAKVGEVPIGWSGVDDTVSKAAIVAALDSGINFFDTADFYGLGHSEKLLGEVLKGKHDAIIATKVGHRTINDAIVLDYSKPYIIDACEASLQRLQRNTIDYYQLHSARLPQLQAGECIEAMQQLQREGKIRYWGVSLNTFHPEAEANFLIEKNLGHGFQLVFNLINQRAVNVMNRAAESGYGIIARMPLQFGLLTGKFSRGERFAEDDHRSFRLTSEIIDKSLDILEKKVWALAEEEQLTKTQLALSFILSFEQVSTVIPGIRTPEHVELNTAGLKQLKEANKALLQSLAPEWETVVALMEKRG